MSNATEHTELIFDTLPLSFLALSEEIFKDSQFSATILSLPCIEDAKATHIARWLHPDESQKLATFTFEKRHREWFGGRICAKQSLRLFHRSTPLTVTFVPRHRQCKVQSEESGRPYFASIDGVHFTFPELSISHSKDFAAAMSSIYPCGIDIQFTAKNLDRVRQRFCSNIEEGLLKDALVRFSDLSRLTLLWSAKEAAKKMLSPGGIPGFQDLQLCNIELRNRTDMILSFSMQNRPTVINTAASMVHKNYAVAICCAAKPEADDQ